MTRARALACAPFIILLILLHLLGACPRGTSTASSPSKSLQPTASSQSDSFRSHFSSRSGAKLSWQPVPLDDGHRGRRHHVRVLRSERGGVHSRWLRWANMPGLLGQDPGGSGGSSRGPLASLPFRCAKGRQLQDCARNRGHRDWSLHCAPLTWLRICFGERRAREVRHTRVALLALAGHAAREVEGGFSPLRAADIPGGVGTLWQTSFCGWVETKLYCLIVEIAARPEHHHGYAEFLLRLCL